MPDLYIISGCNGAGKTTASLTVLPELLNCREFVNADAIATGLSPFQPDSVAFEAGRIMLQRIQTLLISGVTFAIETTLTTKSYMNLVVDAQRKGYRVTLLFYWLNSPELAKSRVRQRVSEGGHSIPDDVIERRYQRGIENLLRIFAPICDHWYVYDNSMLLPRLLAKGKVGSLEELKNLPFYNQ
ncbi:MAG: zeta toxin family protein [Cytophagaceae bacterium]|nr:zeta toxin family protein [Cytophagaceae bacterium]